MMQRYVGEATDLRRFFLLQVQHLNLGQAKDFHWRNGCGKFLGIDSAGYTHGLNMFEHLILPARSKQTVSLSHSSSFLVTI